MHWAIAVPFLVCYTTALILVFVYNPDPSRPFRAAFSWTHRLSGVAFIVLPLLAAARSKGDFRLHLYNVRQAWVWTLDDMKWLALMGLAAISSKVKLPDQGKFNAAEKMNFMVLMGTYPLYIVTGLLVWLPGIAFFSWALHVLMALIATPLVLGHLYMALINPSSRKALGGMIGGFVDRQWAKHHYGRWYREQVARHGGGRRVDPTSRPAPAGNREPSPDVVSSHEPRGTPSGEVVNLSGSETSPNSVSVVGRTRPVERQGGRGRQRG